MELTRIVESAGYVFCVRFCTNLCAIPTAGTATASDPGRAAEASKGVDENQLRRIEELESRPGRAAESSRGRGETQLLRFEELEPRPRRSGPKMRLPRRRLDVQSMLS